MSMSLREAAESPALGDWLERVLHHRRTLLWVMLGLAVAFILVALMAPLVGLLLLAFLMLGGVAIVLYRPREVRGLGRNQHAPGHRR